MDELTEKIQRLALDDDATGIFQLLISWERRDPDWALMVRSKLSAPSTTPKQKQTLKDLLTLWHTESGMDNTQLDQYFQEKLDALGAAQKKDMDTFSLTQHYERYTEIRRGMTDEPSDMESIHQSQWLTLLNRLEQEDQLKERLQRDHHQYLLSTDPENTEESFDRYIQDIKHIFSKTGELATINEINQLSEIANVSISSNLTDFYKQIGGLHGDLFNGYLKIQLFSVNALTAALETNQGRNRLNGLNLYDMIQYSWSNNRSELKIENGFPKAAVDKLKMPLCIGWISDGYLESHAYIVETANNRFGVFYWHQDDALQASALDTIKSYHLSELFIVLIQKLDNMIGQNLSDLNIEELDELFDNIDIDCHLVNELLNA